MDIKIRDNEGVHCYFNIQSIHIHEKERWMEINDEEFDFDQIIHIAFSNVGKGIDLKCCALISNLLKIDFQIDNDGTYMGENIEHKPEDH